MKRHKVSQLDHLGCVRCLHEDIIGIVMERNGKVAFITGGTGGIGSAICTELYDQGYTVVAGYCSGGSHTKAQNWQKQQVELGREMEIAYGDITNYESCKECIESIERKHGAVSVLVNNAGITKDSTFRKMDVDQWHQVIDANLSSVFNMTRLVINPMLKAGFGRIINISSVNGQKGQFGQSNYSAAKAGMHGFTKSLAQEVAHKGVTVNTISPGYIETSMIKAVAEDIRKEILKGIPVGRFGQPEEIGRAVAFLASENSGFITGSNLAANGGQHMF